MLEVEAFLCERGGREDKGGGDEQDEREEEKHCLHFFGCAFASRN